MSLEELKNKADLAVTLIEEWVKTNYGKDYNVIKAEDLINIVAEIDSKFMGIMLWINSNGGISIEHYEQSKFKRDIDNVLIRGGIIENKEQKVDKYV